MNRLATAWLIALLHAGCVTAPRVYTDPAKVAGTVRASWTRVSLFGSTKRVDARATCAHGVARVAIEVPLWGAPLAFVTLGLVTPVRVEVQCAE